MKQLKERFDTLSDAIVGIVMTILVLEIAAPITWSDLPSFFEAIGLFLVSFVVVINFWYSRLQAVRAAEETTMQIFLLDITAHALLSLYPLAIKMLIAFEIKWVAISFFGFLSLTTAFLMNLITVLHGHQAIKGRENEERSLMLMGWLRRKAFMSILSNVIIMAFALCFNGLGVFFYLLVPFVVLFTNYNRGRRWEISLEQGQSYEEFVNHNDFQQSRGRRWEQDDRRRTRPERRAHRGTKPHKEHPRRPHRRP